MANSVDLEQTQEQSDLVCTVCIYAILSDTLVYEILGYLMYLTIEKVLVGLQTL